LGKVNEPVKAFDPKGRYALCSEERYLGANVLALNDGGNKEVDGVDRCSCACFTEDGSRVLVGTHDEDGEPFPLGVKAVIWDHQGGKTTQTLQGRASPPILLRWRDERVTIADIEGSAAEWDLATGVAPRRERRIAAVRRQDQEAFATKARFTVKLNSIAIGNKAEFMTFVGDAPFRTLGVDGDSMTAIALSDDGKLLATPMHSGKLILWDGDSGKQIRTLNVPGEHFAAVALDPDGTRLATGMQSGRIIIWDARDGKQIRSIAAHDEPVQAIEMTPDSKWLFTAAGDGTTRVWDADAGKEIVRLVSLNAGKDWFVLAPDGRYDGSPAALDLIKVRTDGKVKLEPIGKAMKEFHRPGLLAEVLRGNKSPKK
jgi:WD40 repeat protein